MNKKELMKNLVIIFICVILSTVINFFLISPRPPAPASPSESCICPKGSISESFFSDAEIIADIVEEITPSVVHITTEIEHKIIQDPRQFFFEDEIPKDNP